MQSLSRNRLQRWTYTEAGPNSGKCILMGGTFSFPLTKDFKTPADVLNSVNRTFHRTKIGFRGADIGFGFKIYYDDKLANED